MSHTQEPTRWLTPTHVTREDARAFVRYTSPRWHDFSAWTLVIAAAATGVLFAFTEDLGWDEAQRVALTALAPIGVFALARLARVIRARRRVAHFAAAAEPTRYGYDAQGLSIATGATSRVLPWRAVARMDRDEAHLYLRTAPEEGVIVPHRVFESAETMGRFTTFVDSMMRDDDDAAQTAHDGDRSAPTAPLRVGITPQPDDVLRVQRALSGGRSLSWSGTALATAVGGGVIGGALAWGLWRLTNGAFTTTLCSGGACEQTMAFSGAWAGAVLLTWLGARRMESALVRDWPQDDPRRQPREIVVAAEGLIARGADFETRIRWGGVETIRETRDDALFVTRWKEVYTAPRRCFDDDAAFAAFVAGARAWKSNA